MSLSVCGCLTLRASLRVPVVVSHPVCECDLGVGDASVRRLVHVAFALAVANEDDAVGSDAHRVGYRRGGGGGKGGDEVVSEYSEPPPEHWTAQHQQTNHARSNEPPTHVLPDPTTHSLVHPHHNIDLIRRRAPDHPAIWLVDLSQGRPLRAPSYCGSQLARRRLHRMCHPPPHRNHNADVTSAGTIAATPLAIAVNVAIFL